MAGGLGRQVLYIAAERALGRMARVRLVAGFLALVVAGAPGPVCAQSRFFARVGGGTLNPNDPFQTTLAFGGAFGVAEHTNSFLIRVLRQSWNGNAGSDLGNARTYALLDWELAGRPVGEMQRQPFLRLGAGWLWQGPLKSTWVVDLGAGLRYRLAPHLFIVGSLVDDMARLSSQTLVACSGGICTTNEIKAELQQNFGLLVDLEARL